MISSLRSWKLENGVYHSPPFPNITGFNRAKHYLIRGGVTIDSDDRGRIIRIPISGKAHEQNLGQLKKLRLIGS